MKAITTKYHGPTNFKGSRVSASAEGGHKLWMQWDDALNSNENHRAAATALATKMDWSGNWAAGWTEDACVWVNVCEWTPQFVVGKRSIAA
jgi:hypothetical protein